MVKMAEDNIFERMAQFDFSKSINVQITIENSDEELLNINMFKRGESNQTSCCLDETRQTTTATALKDISSGDDLIKLKQIVENIDNSSTKINTTKQKTKNPSSVKSSVNNRVPEMNLNNTNVLTGSNIAEAFKQYFLRNDRQGWAMYVTNLLHKVSAYLILAMQPYYQYSNRNQSQKNYLKNYMFNLSHNTVQSIILPHEKNKLFVEKFIEITVQNANKVFERKCDRKHVKLFYNEMIAWSKKNKDLIKRNEYLINITHGMDNVTINDPIPSKGNAIQDNTNRDRRNEIRDTDNTETNNKIHSDKENENKPNNNIVVEHRSNENNVVRSACTNQNRIDHFKINYNESNRNTENHINRNRINTEFFIANRLNECSRLYNTNTNNIIDEEVNDSRRNVYSTTMNDPSVRISKSRLKCSGLIDIRNHNSKKNKVNYNYIPQNRTDDRIINNNRILTKHLSTAPRPVNFSHSIIAPIPALNLNTDNSTCIFSCGTPGQEISINIDNETLLNHALKNNPYYKDHHHATTAKNSRNNINYPSTFQSNKNQVNYYHRERNTGPLDKSVPNPPSPQLPTATGQTSNVTSTTIPQNFTYNQNSIQPQNVGFDHTTRHTNPAVLGNTHIPLLQKLPTTASVTADQSVISINQNTRRLTGPCLFCRKMTHIVCSKCYKISYCSKQCQIVDTEIRRTLKYRPITRCKNST